VLPNIVLQRVQYGFAGFSVRREAFTFVSAVAYVARPEVILVFKSEFGEGGKRAKMFDLRGFI
jgi:hypothetical protein